MTTPSQARSPAAGPSVEGAAGVPSGQDVDPSREAPRTTEAPTADPSTTDIRRRLKSVEGHVRGVDRMVGEGAYCIDVMNQILAVQRALKKVSGLVLDRHLHHCVTKALRGDDEEERERVLNEVMAVFQAGGRS